MNIPVTAFVKGSGQETIVLPEKLVIELIKNIRKKGSEFVHTNENSYEVTGLLFTGKDFHKEERIILTGTEENL